MKKKTMKADDDNKQIQIQMMFNMKSFFKNKFVSNFRDYEHDLQKGLGKACRWEEVLETRDQELCHRKV